MNKQKYFHLHVPDTAEDSGADGVRCDRDGRVWVATRMGLQICDQPGRVNCIIPTPNGKSSNLTFGGEKFDTLYCTCGDRVYSRKVNVRVRMDGTLRTNPPNHDFKKSAGMTSRQSGRSTTPSPRGGWGIRGLFFLALAASIIACGFLWLIPVEVVQQWAVDRAGSGQYERFEAVGKAEFSLWLASRCCRAARCDLVCLVGFEWLVRVFSRRLGADWRRSQRRCFG